MLRRIVANLTVAVLSWMVVLPLTVLAQPGDTEVQLPDGEPRALIEATCVACHRLDYIPNSRGYTQEGWRYVIGSMIAFPDEQADSIVEYLAGHFPKKPETEPMLIPGPVDVTITEWLAPTLGSRPHDPAPSADGSIWWAGQYANRIGRVDPATGEMEEFPLKTAPGWRK